MAQKPKSKSPVSLAKFSESVTYCARRVCSICVLPEVKELHAAKEQGNVALHTMVVWLRNECGHEHITLPKLENHFRRRHHQKELFE